MRLSLDGLRVRLLEPIPRIFFALRNRRFLRGLGVRARVAALIDRIHRHHQNRDERSQRDGGQNPPVQRRGLRGVRGDFQQAAKRLALLLRRLDAPVFPMGDRLARNAHGLRHLLLRQLFFLSRGGDPLCKRRHIERSPLHLF